MLITPIIRSKSHSTGTVHYAGPEAGLPETGLTKIISKAAAAKKLKQLQAQKNFKSRHNFHHPAGLTAG